MLSTTPTLFDPGPPPVAKIGRAEKERRCKVCHDVTPHRLRITRNDKGEAERRWTCASCFTSVLDGGLWCERCGCNQLRVEAINSPRANSRPRAKIQLRRCVNPRCQARWLYVMRRERRLE
jgi:hypothetical protein